MDHFCVKLLQGRFCRSNHQMSFLQPRLHLTRVVLPSPYFKLVAVEITGNDHWQRKNKIW